jgi:hypothetical protein
VSSIRLGIVTAAAAVLLTPALRAQGVAFQPVVGSLPVGPVLNTTPAVSLDRRYVRLGINVQFIDNAAFTTFSVPGAVTGGPSGPGALGGIGLGGAGGGGGGAAGVGGAGVGGGQFLAGMNGVVDPSVGYYPTGFPPEAAFSGYPTPQGMAAEGFGMMPGGPVVQRAIPPRTGARKALKPGRNLGGKAKQPTSAGSAAPAPLTTGMEGRRAR